MGVRIYRNMQDIGDGIQLRNNIDPLLESLAMAHYTVYYHLGTAALLFTRLHQEFYEDILFHLYSAIEMVERLIFILAKLKFQNEKKVLTIKLTQDEILAKAQNYYSNEDGYEEDFKDFLKKGRAVNLYLHKIEEVTKEFMQIISKKRLPGF
jgi:hypothetical protein